MEPLQLAGRDLRYSTLVGTGGIGSGVFFAVNGDHTLGREESRSGRFLDRRDYCKLHIITHYIQTLMGDDFTTFPVGKVGDDGEGRRLLEEMAEAGLNLQLVQTAADRPTMYCVCVVYPDGSGGNLTVDDSACAEVDAAYVRQAEPAMASAPGSCIALAVPEVPLAARQELLELAGRHGCLRAASFTSEEIIAARDAGMLAHVDLLAINIDEARALVERPPDDPAAAVVEAGIECLGSINPSMQVSVTAGSQGSWVWDGQTLRHSPSLEVDAASTAGAGDALFAGTLAGMAAGLSLPQAHELGVLTAALSVTSPHTIDTHIDRRSLGELADRLQPPLSSATRSLLAGLG